MASVTKRKNKSGTVYDVQFYQSRNVKKSIYGFKNKAQAEAFGRFVDRLVTAKGHINDDRELVNWLEKLAKDSPERYGQLVKFGLVKPVARAGTLAELVNMFIMEASKKERTIKDRRTLVNRLVAFFKEKNKKADPLARPVDSFTSQEANEFYQYMQKELAPSTWKRDIGRAKQLFKIAIQIGWIKDNPFKGCKGGASVNPGRFHFVTLDECQAILQECTSLENRLVFVLARFGGLRIPSEIEFMEWKDFNIADGYFIVKIPKKTNKHNQEIGNFATRIVPLFKEIENAVREYFDSLPEGAPSLVFPERPTGQALRNRFRGILRRAGVEMWEKFFQNMRSTRETELLCQFQIKEVTDWIGNSPLIALKHYLQPRPEMLQCARKFTTMGAETGKTAEAEIPSSTISSIE